MKRLLAICLFVFALPAWAQFDHSHKAWDALLKKHVVLLPGSNALTAVAMPSQS